MSYHLAVGVPEAFPEMPVNVSGFKPEINDTLWLVKKARHSIADNGLVTDLEMEVRDDPTTDRHRSHFRKGGR
jgi:phage protein D